MDCSGCTLCCKLIKIDWMNSPAGEYCKECDQGVGCKIYDHIPKKCLKFRCAYNQMEKVSIDLRPDNCDIIFERLSEDIFIGTVDPDIRKLKDIVKGQINAFNLQGFSVILLNQKIKNPHIYPASNKNIQSIWNRYIQEIEKINGSA